MSTSATRRVAGNNKRGLKGREQWGLLVGGVAAHQEITAKQPLKRRRGGQKHF